MLRMILRLRFLLFCSMTLHLTYAVDFDYYFSALRSKKTCSNITEKVNCQMKCGVETGMCIGNECYCLAVSTLKEYGIKDLKNVMSRLLKHNDVGQRYSDFHDYNELPDVQYERRNADTSQETPEYLDETLLYNKPVLRHHIAHFCPNLDIARTCIRTCMREGKPAFCGKDHVCYCGHRYSNKDRNPAVDVSSVYAQFKDLYETYFGPNYKQEINVK